MGKKRSHVEDREENVSKKRRKHVEAASEDGDPTVRQHRHRHKHRRTRKEKEEDCLPHVHESEVIGVSSKGKVKHKRRHRSSVAEEQANGSQCEVGTDHNPETEDSVRSVEVRGVEVRSVEVRGVRRELEDRRCGRVLWEEESEGPVLKETGAEMEGVDQFGALHGRWVKGTKAELERFREEVGEWSKGRWSAREIEQLKCNVREFMKERHITDLGQYIFESDNKRQTRLYKYIAKDINRPLFNIYRKMIRVCDVTHYVGRWTEEQEKELLRLHQLHGDRWALIGKTLEISAEAVRSKYRLLKKEKGPWTPGEEKRLTEAIQHLREQWRQTEEGEEEEVTGEDIPPNATWEDVAARVGTRTAYQCRQKWTLQLHWLEEGGREKWSVSDSIHLLRELASEDPEDEESVEWQEMSEGWGSARGRTYLRNKWAILKREVPNYRINSFRENLDYLLAHRLPALERSELAATSDNS